MDHVPHSMEYTRLVCATHVTYMDIPRMLNLWIFHVCNMHGYSTQFTHGDFTCVDTLLFMALLFNACITLGVLPVAITH